MQVLWRSYPFIAESLKPVICALLGKQVIQNRNDNLAIELFAVNMTSQLLVLRQLLCDIKDLVVLLNHFIWRKTRHIAPCATQLGNAATIGPVSFCGSSLTRERCTWGSAVQSSIGEQK